MALGQDFGWPNGGLVPPLGRSSVTPASGSGEANQAAASGRERWRDGSAPSAAVKRPAPACDCRRLAAIAAQETSNLRGPAPFQQAYLGQRRMARTQLAKIRWWRVALAWGLFTVFMVLLVYVQAQASVHPVPWRLVVLGVALY